MSSNFLEKATNSKQYDDLEWVNDGGPANPTRTLFQRLLKRNIEDISGKTVLDIGSGTGHFYPLFKDAGVLKVIGIEPSKKNIAVSKQYYPEFEVIHESAESFQTKEVFDVALASMVFEHIQDVKGVFKKVFDLLVSGGIFYVLVSDMDYLTTPRFNYEVQVEKVDDDTLALETKRKSGTMYDLVRPVGYYSDIAQGVGFQEAKIVPQKPDEEFLRAKPEYQQFTDKILAYLLVFKKI